MLGRRYRHTGIGVAYAHGYYWITQIFYGWAGLDRSTRRVVRCSHG
jgi:hypothetical protein